VASCFVALIDVNYWMQLWECCIAVVYILNLVVMFWKLEKEVDMSFSTLEAHRGEWCCVGRCDVKCLSQRQHPF